MYSHNDKLLCLVTYLVNVDVFGYVEQDVVTDLFSSIEDSSAGRKLRKGTTHQLHMYTYMYTNL